MICAENARLSSLVVVVTLAETQATHGSASFGQAWAARSRGLFCKSTMIPIRPLYRKRYHACKTDE